MQKSKSYPFAPLVILSLLICLTFTAAGQQDQPPVRTITGRVTDSETIEGLYLANVYIANTALGSATNEDGEFLIFNVPYGEHRLIVTYFGYEPFKTVITVDSTDFVPLIVGLKPEVLTHEQVVVTAERPKDWDENLVRFAGNLLGTSSNAAQCRIVNPEVLDFTPDAARPFYIYCEIYNLRTLGAGARYTIDITAKTDQSKRNWFSRLFRGSGSATTPSA